jgi:hypothetical protein
VRFIAAFLIVAVAALAFGLLTYLAYVSWFKNRR